MLAGKCPNCGKPRAQEFNPFCSRHCANLDLGRWLDGRYTISTEEIAGPMAAQGRDDDQD